MDDDKIKRIKNKLFLYGSYTREHQKLSRRMLEIDAAMEWHQDWPEAAARESGFRDIDAHHPAVQQMLIERVSLTYQLKKIVEERTALNLDTFISHCTEEEKSLIRMIFVEELNRSQAAFKLNYSRQGVDWKIQNLCRRLAAAS